MMLDPNRLGRARIRELLASHGETSAGEFTLPMLTGVLRVRRL